MKILGFMGSPHIKGISAKLISSALQGAGSKGAETKRYDLIKCDIKYCKGCFRCVYENHELSIGECPIKDDMADILEEYHNADGYIFATPVYDVYVTALMKTFLERKFPLFYRKKEDYGKVPAARVPANFKKKASMIVTGNGADEFREVMGDPCFEALETDFMIEQVDTTGKLYVGGVDNISKEKLSKKLDETFEMGVSLAEEIEKAQKGI